MNKYFLKLNKKLGQAVNTLTKVEKMCFEQLITNEETGRFIVVHFGLGTEGDYLGLRNFLLDFGLEEKSFSLDMYPGYPHSFLYLNSIETAHKLNSFIHQHNIDEIQLLKEQKEKKEKESKKTLKAKKEGGDLAKNFESSGDRKFLMKSINLKFEDRQRNCFFFNTPLFAAEMKCFSSQNNSLQPASTNYEELLKHGLFVLENLLTKEEEAILLEEIYKNDWENLSQRRVQHYGYKFMYGANSIDKTKMIGSLPEWTTNILKSPNFEELFNSINLSNFKTANDFSTTQIAEKTEDSNLKEIPKETPNKTESNDFAAKNKKPFPHHNLADYFDQLTINEYQPGSGIPPHTDSHTPFEEALASVSLLSDIVMAFKNPLTGQETHVLIPARSALILTGESRYLWTHSIASRKIDRVPNGLLFRRRRVSLTFRKSRALPFCDCPYPIQCDFIQDKKSAKVKEEIDISKPEFEKKYVKDVYNSIAEHFSHTRYKAWPSVKAFLKTLPSGSIVGDIGCGNGKYMFCVNHLQFVASDIAVNFAKICREKDQRAQVLLADALSVPFRDNSLDHAISIAVIHHLSTADRRRKAIRELLRIVRPGGRILIYVWAFEQADKKFAAQDLFVPWNNQPKFEPESQADDIDKRVNEAKRTIVYKRFYHVFKKGELEQLVDDCQAEMQVRVEIKDSYYDHENWCIELLKKEPIVNL